ncbi:hypothetical protein NB636_02145 [Oxalobacter aliiformigenes]|uniref:hypothetical protein n=1 Tax=Oxalobacter aliiformigenes TaxID=2946593 RepID=UPI0022AED556|nr:hypothetical protein [Oxalobacter aliiformigenes]MCZ4065674.1 hypothetical protein [Oxalobacter aliiformigenes]WAV99689.1 hypothetical protein NB636_02145 [Oxalobacter aliiformigenes]
MIPDPFGDKLISQQQGSFDGPEKWKYVGNDDILKRFIRYFTDFRFCDLLPEPERGYQVRQVFLQLFLSYRRMLFVTQITGFKMAFRPVSSISFLTSCAFFVFLVHS